MQHGSKQGRNAIEDFEKAPIPKVIIRNCIPALIAMVMVMVYNLADTYFIGLTHDDLKVAAVSLGTPVFMIFMSLGTLFGVGGSSVISRALGAGDRERARKACAFSFWCSVGTGLLFMILLWLFMDKIVVMMGASQDTLEYTRSYLSIIISCGVFSMIATCMSSIVRTEGEPMKAMTGTVIGNLINMVLDPVMILLFDWGVAGAAVATVIGNLFGAVYYLLYFLRGKSKLSISPKSFTGKGGICSGVLAVGISASLANLLVSLSSLIMNRQLAEYGDLYLAGYGVTSKVLLIVTLIGIGVGSGAQPMFGYCFGAKNFPRLKAAIRFAAGFGLAICLALAAIGILLAKPVVDIFLTNEASLSCAVRFTRTLMSTAWLIGAFAVCQNALQAMGAATPALLATVFRQGVIFVPAVYILKHLFGLDGLIWAQPAADVLSLVIIAVMLVLRIRKAEKDLKRQEA